MKKPQRELVLIWRIRLLALTLIPSFLTSFLLWDYPFFWRLATVGWCLGAAFFFFWYCPKRYDRLEYGIHQNIFQVTDGVFWHKLKGIPLGNIQSVSLSTTWLLSCFGLTTLKVRGAGSLLAVPGLPKEYARRLQSFLLESRGGQNQ